MRLRPAAEMVRFGLALCFAHRAFCARLILRLPAADMVRDEPFELLPPETDSNTFTYAINRYFRPRTQLAMQSSAVEAVCSACPGVVFIAKGSSHRPNREEFQKSIQAQFDEHCKAVHSQE